MCDWAFRSGYIHNGSQETAVMAYVCHVNEHAAPARDSLADSLAILRSYLSEKPT